MVHTRRRRRCTRQCTIYEIIIIYIIFVIISILIKTFLNKTGSCNLFGFQFVCCASTTTHIFFFRLNFFFFRLFSVLDLDLGALVFLLLLLYGRFENVELTGTHQMRWILYTSITLHLLETRNTQRITTKKKKNHYKLLYDYVENRYIQFFFCV